MPSLSPAQHGFAAMSKSAKGRAKLRAEGKTPMPQNVAQEYMNADRGRKIGSLSKHAAKKKGKASNA
jgi:hypothetical protein